jgi:hypothetical protein
MWDRDKSVVLSLVCTRIIMAFGVLLAAMLIYLSFADPWFVAPWFASSDTALHILIVYLVFCIPAYQALFSLDRLLSAVRRDQVFTEANVRNLRIISWCCFGAGVILLAGWLAISPVFLIIAILAAFFGLILRVVKNLFAAAVALKAENDFTI